MKPVADDTLEGWKEIAGYLHLSESGAHDWEKRLGLPVLRMGRKVYASKSAIAAWFDRLATSEDEC